MTDINDAIGTGIGLGVGLAVTGSVINNFNKMGSYGYRKPRRKVRRKKRK